MKRLCVEIIKPDRPALLPNARDLSIPRYCKKRMMRDRDHESPIITSFVRSPRENWRIATPRTMIPATTTVKNGSGRSPACPTRSSTSSSEMLVSANCRVLMIRGAMAAIVLSSDIFKLVGERHLTNDDLRGVKH